MFKRISLLFLSAVFLSACTLKLPSLPGAKKSGLQVTVSPQATIFLNGNSIGLTPVLEDKLSPGEYTVRIVPSDSSLQPWEAKVTLTGGVLTVIDRKLSLTPDQSHGYTLSFEKVNTKDSQLAVSTLPDSVTVTVDGNPQGFAPLSQDNLSEGDHTIILSSPGYEDKLIRARTISGFRLTVSAQLAKKAAPPPTIAEATPSAESSSLIPTPSKKSTPTPTKKASIMPTPIKTATSSATIAKPYVEINNPVDKFANVRATPARDGELLTTVDHGEQFPYLSLTENGYHKIEYAPGKQGWVASQYATVVK